VEKAVLLRERGTEIGDDHTAAGRDLRDACLDQAQKALAAEGALDALDVVRIARTKFFGRHVRRHFASSCRFFVPSQSA